MGNQPTLRCPLNGAPCPGRGKCKAWIDYPDAGFSGCVLLASEEILSRIGREVGDFLKSPIGKATLTIAASLLGGSFKPRVNVEPQNTELPVPTKKEPR